jgi:hypothetical protein
VRFVYAYLVVALASAAIGIWDEGHLDPVLSHVGLNRHSCATPVPGDTLCGRDLVEFCRAHISMQNVEPCWEALEEEGIDPSSLLVDAIEDCIAQEVEGSGAPLDKCGATEGLGR